MNESVEIKALLSFRQNILRILSTVVGLLLVLSAIGKMINVSVFAGLIVQMGFPVFKIFAPVIIITEMIFGLMLVLHYHIKRVSSFAFFILVVFTIIYLYGNLKYGIRDCGCFGTLLPLTLSPLITIIRNLIIISILIITWIFYPIDIEIQPDWKKYTIIVFTVITSFVSGVNSEKGFFYHLDNFSAHHLENKALNKTFLLKYLDIVSDSTYLIFAMQYNCPHCWNSIENFKAFQKYGFVDKIIAISIKDNKKMKREFVQFFKPEFLIIEMERDKFSQLFDVVPTYFFIENDTIRNFSESDVPSPRLYYKTYVK